MGHLKQDRNIQQLVTLQQDGRIHVVVVGSTTTEQSRSQVDALTRAGCTVVDEYIPRIEEYYQAADCYVFPTLDERAAIQVPLSILEALAVSLPVVTTDFGGLKDTFENHNLPLRYVDESEFPMLAEIVVRHVESRPTSSTSLSFLDWANVAKRLVTVYDE